MLLLRTAQQTGRPDPSAPDTDRRLWRSTARGAIWRPDTGVATSIDVSPGAKLEELAQAGPSNRHREPHPALPKWLRPSPSTRPIRVSPLRPAGGHQSPRRLGKLPFHAPMPRELDHFGTSTNLFGR